MSTSNRVPLSPGFWARGGKPGTQYHISGGLYGAMRLRARMNGIDGPTFASAAGYTQTTFASYDAPAAATPQPVKRSLNLAEIMSGAAIPPSPVTATPDPAPVQEEETPVSWASFCRINPINIPPPSPIASSFPRDARTNASAPLISAAPSTRAFSTNSPGKAPSPKAAKNERQKANRFAPYDLCFRPKKQLHTETPVFKAPNLEQYHELADEYMASMLTVLEDLADGYSNWEVDYVSGVINLTTDQGTFVINKQPPNKQIWLSSPVSGPKRFDYREADYVSNVDGKMHRGGKWVYLREGTTLTELLEIELEHQFAEDIQGEDRKWVDGKFSEASEVRIVDDD